MGYKYNPFTGELDIAGTTVTGTTGSTGPAGFTGANGSDGVTGQTGPTGSIGTSGSDGITGTTGSQGIQGEKGDPGVSGATGSTGATGADSTVEGPTGSAGSDGVTGSQGVTGSTGADGATGSTGVGGSTLEYMMPVWAEENAALASNGHEWAFGNGANSAIDDGIVIYVPSGWTCSVVAMSLKLGATPTSISVQLNLNGVSQGASCNVTSTGRLATNDSFTPLAIVNGDYINFRTQTVSGSTAGPNVVCAFLRFVKT